MPEDARMWWGAVMRFSSRGLLGFYGVHGSLALVEICDEQHIPKQLIITWKNDFGIWGGLGLKVQRQKWMMNLIPEGRSIYSYRFRSS